MMRRVRTGAWQAGLAAVVLAAGLAVAPAWAQVGQRGPAVVTDLPRADVQALRAWLQNRNRTDATPPPIAFKVPANAANQVICNINAEGIRCFQTIVTVLQCPTEVVVQLPDGGTQRVPVTCTGPDRDGNCECDFAG